MFRKFSLLVVAILALSPPVRAETVDAQCPIPWWQMEWNVVALGPIAQSFIATASGMDYVDLLIAEGPSNSTGVSLALVIHAGGMEGEVVASSLALELPDAFNEVARFRFAGPVQLVPGATYAFRIVRTSESGYAMVRGAINDPCPALQAWISGAPSAYADLWFQIGTVNTVRGGESSVSRLKERFETRPR